jgi:adenine-specific DNA methylase
MDTSDTRVTTDTLDTSDTKAKRLIEVDFPLKQTSLDSVHEKNVRHGHISTLHIWPARRPLAASRAALIATLLPDPGNDEERTIIMEKLAGRIVEHVKKKKSADGRVEEQVIVETEGGILHWGRESGADLQWFRDKIRAAYGGRAPKVLDPFSGGGAIPLEAMRLGCDVTAVDINPVAWFILKCTLEYPQQLANQQRPLPTFALQSREFMEAYFKARGFKGAALAAQLAAHGLPKAGTAQPELMVIETHVTSVEADLAWHVRAWGWWVLQQARADLSRYYPTIENKPTVAYLWARTVTCKNCRATVPLLKTRWLCKKDNKRVVLTMEPNAERTGVVFGVLSDAPILKKGTTAQKREHDKQMAGGTMSRSGVACPCCNTIMTMENIRREAHAGRLSEIMTTVVVDGENGKEYRRPTEEETFMATKAEKELSRVYAEIPFGLPSEPTPTQSQFSGVANYGLLKWSQLFTPRQLLALGTFVKHTRAAHEVMQGQGYSQEWAEAVSAYLALALDRLADYSSSVCSWHNSKEQLRNTFGRFALPITWDFTEVGVCSETSGGYLGAIEWIVRFISHALIIASRADHPSIVQSSAIQISSGSFDAIVTDPPYYDAIPYSDLMDFFYVWLRRTLFGLSPEIDAAFQNTLSPKWDHEHNDGELIDDSSRFGGDKQKSKVNYEDGMARVFQSCYRSLNPNGRLVIVFAHKHPDAWETLVSALIRAGFVVDGSWPIQTEMGNRTRALSSAALASSVWLVCKKRPENARPGWDNLVLEEMQTNIIHQLRYFWDVGIRGPDFVWAATGPALEAYSKHPIVKKANEPGKVMGVSEFLGHVRRMVADFVVGRVLTQNGGSEAVSGLDDVTTYYLLHRYNFGMENAPIGPCILYAVSCNLSDTLLLGKYDLLIRTGGQSKDEDDDVADEEVTEGESEVEEGTSSTVKLKTWSQRKNAGLEAPGLYTGAAIPLIDKVHRLMHLWQAGDVSKVDEYLESHALGYNTLFGQLLQALIELAGAGSTERALLESISNHVKDRSGVLTNRLNWME